MESSSWSKAVPFVGSFFFSFSFWASISSIAHDTRKPTLAHVQEHTYAPRMSSSSSSSSTAYEHDEMISVCGFARANIKLRLPEVWSCVRDSGEKHNKTNTHSTKSLRIIITTQLKIQMAGVLFAIAWIIVSNTKQNNKFFIFLLTKRKNLFKFAWWKMNKK